MNLSYRWSGRWGAGRIILVMSWKVCGQTFAMKFFTFRSINLFDEVE